MKWGPEVSTHLCFCDNTERIPETVKGEKLEVSDWMEAPDTPVTQHQELPTE
jgi:hypothetical protein